MKTSPQIGELTRKTVHEFRWIMPAPTPTGLMTFPKATPTIYRCGKTAAKQ